MGNDVSAATLRTEAEVLGRYLLSRPIEAEFVDRYVMAHEFLFRAPPRPRDRAVIAFAVAHPRLLPCLDAAGALAEPARLLHDKCLLMAAILEASPRHADEFLPRTTSFFGLLALLVRVGLTNALGWAIGLPLIRIVGRRA